MGCSRCVHWDGDYQNKTGACTRNPKHVVVDADHFCGERKVEHMNQYGYIGNEYTFIRKVPADVYYYNQLNLYSDREQAAYKKLSAERNKLKELRKMYKQETGKTARIKK